MTLSREPAGAADAWRAAAGQHLPALRMRVVNVVDLMTLQPVDHDHLVAA